MRKRRARKPRKKLVILDPLNSVQRMGMDLSNAESVIEQDQVRDIHKTLIESQNQLQDIWKSAQSAMDASLKSQVESGFSPLPNVSDEGAESEEQPNSEGNQSMNQIEEIAAQEKKITQTKVAAIPAQTERIHNALVETQNKLTRLWAQAEQTVSDNVASAAEKTDQPKPDKAT